VTVKWLLVTWWNLVFWAKCRAGFRLLGPVSISGVVTAYEVSEDGDTCFDVQHLSLVFHCEVAPADRERLAGEIARLTPGVRVRVGGTRAWDGCHHGRGVIFDVLMALLRAAPVLDGWIEIHPTKEIEVLL
jgi:hypothetical protein